MKVLAIRQELKMHVHTFGEPCADLPTEAHAAADEAGQSIPEFGLYTFMVVEPVRRQDDPSWAYTVHYVRYL